MGIHQITSRILLIVLLVLMPLVTLRATTRPPANQASNMHLAAMAGYAFLAMASFRLTRTRLAAVLVVFTLSALMELLQHLVQYRNGSWADVGINAAGGIIGVLVFLAGNRLCALIKKRLWLS